MEPTLFWQLLLAAEASYTKSRAFIETHDSFPFESVETFLGWPNWTDKEALRISKAARSIHAALGAPFTVLTESSCPCLTSSKTVAVFYQGNQLALESPRISIVGTRNASPYGKGLARKFGSAFAQAGVTVVSGGALGVDAAAHEGALAVEGRSIAVLANGLDSLFPPEHRQLFFRLVQQGGLVTAYAFGSGLRPDKFLARNGIIAALSDAVLLIEGPVRSGALSTLRAAVAQQKPVFAIPGEPNMESFQGSQAAIKDGLATSVSAPDQILAALNLPNSTTSSTEISELGRHILTCLGATPKPLEILADLAHIEIGTLLSELTILELHGQVIRSDGGYAVIP